MERGRRKLQEDGAAFDNAISVAWWFFKFISACFQLPKPAKLFLPELSQLGYRLVRTWRTQIDTQNDDRGSIWSKRYMPPANGQEQQLTNGASAHSLKQWKRTREDTLTLRRYCTVIRGMASPAVRRRNRKGTISVISSLTCHEVTVQVFHKRK